MYLVPVYFQQAGPGTTPTSGARVQRGGVHQTPDFHYAQQQNPRVQRPLAAITAPELPFLGRYPWRAYGWQSRQMDPSSMAVQAVAFRLYLQQVGTPAVAFPKLGPWRPGAMDAARAWVTYTFRLPPLPTAGAPIPPVVPAQIPGGRPRHGLHDYRGNLHYPRLSLSQFLVWNPNEARLRGRMLLPLVQTKAAIRASSPVLRGAVVPRVHFFGALIPPAPIISATFRSLSPVKLTDLLIIGVLQDILDD